MKSFGEKLKELRCEKKLTQKELAGNLSITISTLSHWECGYQEPSFKDLIAISQFFEIDTNYLIGVTDEFETLPAIHQSTAPSLSSEEKRLIESYKKLRPDLKQMLWQMIEVWESLPANTKPNRIKKQNGTEQ